MERENEDNSTDEIEITDEMIDVGEKVLLLGWQGCEREAVTAVYIAMCGIYEKSAPSKLSEYLMGRFSLPETK
jgi:hypothetical protein